MLPRLFAVDSWLPSRRRNRANPAGIRLLDVIGAATGLALLAPLLLGIGIATKLTSRGPALFRSTRVGKNGRPFILYKFRSMVIGAESIGPAITSALDPRVTRLGATLRRLKLDELPQLLNVLIGDMALVGPRPEGPAYVAMYSREQLAILDAKPGMTSPASLQYRDEETQLTGDNWEDHYLRQVMPEKLRIDSDYLCSRTLLSDVKIILGTLTALVARKAGDLHD